MNAWQPDSAQTVKVLLFASLREQAGWSDRCIPLNALAVSSAREIWDRLELGDLPPVVRVAIKGDPFTVNKAMFNYYVNTKATRQLQIL